MYAILVNCEGIYRIIRICWIADTIFVVCNNTESVRRGWEEVLVWQSELLWETIVGSCHYLPSGVIWNNREKSDARNDIWSSHSPEDASCGLLSVMCIS
jgi:hypothetical protein